MQKNKAAQPTTIRNHNRRLVLVTLEKQGRISRADLAKLTRISEPTVSGIIEDFIRKGLVRELGPGATVSGRKPVLLEFDPASGYVIGIDVGAPTLKWAFPIWVEICFVKKKSPAKPLERARAP